MRQKSGPEKQPAEDAIRDIRRAARRHFSEAFDVSFGVARDDDLLSLADCRRATFGEVGRTTKLPPLMF